MKKYFFWLTLVMVFSSCLKEDAFKLNYTGFTPQQIDDDWQISSPNNESMDSALLEKAYELIYEDSRYTMARSLLVIRNGKLVAEAYPNDINDIHKKTNIQSCTKSITSIAMGIAMEGNLIDSLTEKLYDIYPEHFDADVNKRSITIEDALTMQTGLEFDNSEHTLELFQTQNNSVELVLAQDRLYPSGLIMNYNDGAPHLLSKVIEKKANKSLAQYTNEQLFLPLNITDWMWESSKDQTTFGAFSLYLKPRDFGKIGQMLLQNGTWNNQQLIDSAYLVEATSPKVSASFHSEPYGYYFWVLPSYNAYCALGHGGQFLFVVPDKQLLVVYTAWPYTSAEFFGERSELMDIIYSSCN